MRLLKFDGHGELSLTKDLIDDIPRYAIFSHTWGADDETTKLTLLIDAPEDNKPSLSALIESFLKLRIINIGERALARAQSSHTIPIVAAALNGKRDGAPECLYHEFHWYQECPYLNERARSPEWIPDSTIQEQIVKRLRNRDLKAKIDRKVAWSNRNNGDNNEYDHRRPFFNLNHGNSQIAYSTYYLRRQPPSQIIRTTTP